MEWLKPLHDEDMDDNQQRTFERALGKLGIEQASEAPTWLRILANSPEFLKDFYMNYDRQIADEKGSLDMKVKFVLGAAIAAHEGQRDVAEFFAQRAMDSGFNRDQVYEAIGIGATSTSFNNYYKFRSLAGSNDFDGFNPGLRATLFMRPSTGKAFAELVNLVLSTNNGCPSCVSGHIDEAQEHDVGKPQIDEAVRTGAIVSSVCSFVRSSEHYSAD